MLSKTIFATVLMALAASVAAAPTGSNSNGLGDILSPGSSDSASNLGNLLSPGSSDSASAEGNGNGSSSSIPYALFPTY